MKEDKVMGIKERMTDYWTQRVEKFSELRMAELKSNKSRLWMNEFESYLPKGRKLKILDVGTGTGFFCMLLGAEGHEMTGIDLTEDMILEAREVAGSLGIDADFYVMDAENPDFEEQSFDAIVTRNLTWTLPHIDQAYEKWHKLLKPDGILINFDADYCREKKLEEIPKNCSHKGIAKDLMTEYESMKNVLRDQQKPRPEWDMELLAQVGFNSIQLDETVWGRIYGEIDEFYNPTPIFTITARA